MKKKRTRPAYTPCPVRGREIISKCDPFSCVQNEQPVAIMYIPFLAKRNNILTMVGHVHRGHDQSRPQESGNDHCRIAQRGEYLTSRTSGPSDT